MTDATQAIEQVKQQYSNPDSTIGEEELDTAIGVLEEATVDNSKNQGAVQSVFNKVSVRDLGIGILLFVLWPIIAAGVLGLQIAGFIDFRQEMEVVLAGVGVWFTALFLGGFTSAIAFVMITAAI